MLKQLILSLGILTFSALPGCSTWDKLDRTEKGAVIGGGSGAVLGSAVGGTTGTVVGGAAGAVGGGLIGRHTEDDD